MWISAHKHVNKYKGICKINNINSISPIRIKAILLKIVWLIIEVSWNIMEKELCWIVHIVKLKDQINFLKHLEFSDNKVQETKLIILKYRTNDENRWSINIFWCYKPWNFKNQKAESRVKRSNSIVLFIKNTYFMF